MKRCRKCGAAVDSKYPRPLCWPCWNQRQEKKELAQPFKFEESRASREKRLHGVPQAVPCEYACGRFVYSVFPGSLCNPCRIAHRLPVFNGKYQNADRRNFNYWEWVKTHA